MIDTYTSPKCPGCLKPFYPNRPQQKYCTKECRNSEGRNRTYLTLPIPEVNTANRGAIGELRVAADLLEKGYEIFRAVSASCSCDLIALRTGKALRIEVRTGYETRKGIATAGRKNFRADVLAIVTPIRIVYDPELEPEKLPQETTPD